MRVKRVILFLGIPLLIGGLAGVWGCKGHVSLTPTPTPTSTPTSTLTPTPTLAPTKTLPPATLDWWCQSRWVQGPCQNVSWQQVLEIAEELRAVYGIDPPQAEPELEAISGQLAVSRRPGRWWKVSLQDEMAWALGIQPVAGIGPAKIWILKSCGNPAVVSVEPTPTATAVSPTRKPPTRKPPTRKPPTATPPPPTATPEPTETPQPTPRVTKCEPCEGTPPPPPPNPWPTETEPPPSPDPQVTATESP